MNERELIEVILDHLVNARLQGADRVHFDALAIDDDETTLGDLVDNLMVLQDREPRGH